MLKLAGMLGGGVFLVTFIFLYSLGSIGVALLLSLVFGVGSGFWLYNEKRETIMVKDVMHGRYFRCKSVIELAKKEAWLANVISGLRQVMVGAKNWDGEERFVVEPLPKEEAKQALLKL